MYSLVNQNDLEAIFRNAAIKLNLSEAIVEKDFWVCFVLDYLFSKCKYKDALTFKGGTSLSKCYNLINRFSEDIDLILDWRILGYGIEEPWISRSNTKQDLFNKEANLKAIDFIESELLPTIKDDLSIYIKKPFSIYILDSDKQTICFEYPQTFKDESILQVIRLELGALAAWTPSCDMKVKSYLADVYPNIFTHSSSEVLTVAAERTFWEKVTILHHEANRPESLTMPLRYSRHYYDLYCISRSAIKKSALDNIALLEKVVNFKMKFYPRKWAEYDKAIPGSLKLMPPDYRINELKRDYLNMKNMIFDNYPVFDEIMAYLKELENEINSSKS